MYNIEFTTNYMKDLITRMYSNKVLNARNNVCDLFRRHND